MKLYAPPKTDNPLLDVWLERLVKELTKPIFSALTRVGDASNYMSVDDDGEITLAGTARVNRHLWVNATSMKKNGAEDGIQGVNSHVIFRDGQDDEIYYSDHVPYRRAAGSDVIIELLWYYTGGNQAGNCLWNLTYNSIAHIGEDPTGAGIALTQQAINIATDDTVGHVSFTIPAAALASHGTLLFKVWRNGNDGLDTLGVNALLLGVHMHFLMDKLGEST